MNNIVWTVRATKTNIAVVDRVTSLQMVQNLQGELKKLNKLADIVNITKSSGPPKLSENLDMRKLYAGWVPQLLRLEQKLCP